CYALCTMKVTNRCTNGMAKATKCNPASGLVKKFEYNSQRAFKERLRVHLSGPTIQVESANQVGSTTPGGPMTGSAGVFQGLDTVLLRVRDIDLAKV
ncbi:hypothetical protein, partial [Caldilinea sp.]|uniref:hypothetical protein n=1 Tax=Caldilinea sp. TaxID=2293560 RepID=UPI001B24E844